VRLDLHRDLERVSVPQNATTNRGSHVDAEVVPLGNRAVSELARGHQDGCGAGSVSVNVELRSAKASLNSNFGSECRGFESLWAYWNNGGSREPTEVPPQEDGI
jgi:hypothetical protein